MDYDLSNYTPVDVERLFSLCSFDKRTQSILRLRFGLDSGIPLSLEDVGILLDLTREQVRTIEAKAIKVIRSVSLVDWNRGRS